MQNTKIARDGIEQQRSIVVVVAFSAPLQQDRGQVLGISFHKGNLGVGMF